MRAKKTPADLRREIRRLRSALRDAQAQADQMLEGTSRSELDILTDPGTLTETIYAVTTEALMGPVKFQKWVEKRRREIAEAT